MLHPNQFEVNDAWIGFRLNGVPIQTERDGDFNCIALMDAASCFILGSDLIPATDAEPDSLVLHRLFEKAKRHKREFPTMLFVPHGDDAAVLTREATRHRIDVVHVADSELLVFIGEARESFSERFEQDPS